MAGFSCVEDVPLLSALHPLVANIASNNALAKRLTCFIAYSKI
ncbi:hypothetical protein MPQ_0451 [Methylovorus sp. MP688]|jgi:hypothetical protein|nr:hypothetical protein MPQ_0451 [Methylovorus sp. MP688]